MYTANGSENLMDRFLSGTPARDAPRNAPDVGDIAANITATAQKCLAKIDNFLGLTPLGRLIGLTAVVDSDLMRRRRDDNPVVDQKMRLPHYAVILLPFP